MVNEIWLLEFGSLFPSYKISNMFCMENWAKSVMNQEKLSKWKMILIKSSLTLNFLRIFKNVQDRFLGRNVANCLENQKTELVKLAHALH